MFKKVLATATVVAMLTGTFSMNASAADWGQEGGTANVVGSNYAVNPTIEVELPGELTFGVNPLYLDANDDGTADPQIVSGDYVVTNYSNVGVLITSNTKATVKDTCKLLADAAWDATTGELEADASKKAVYLTLMLPKVEVKDGAPVLTAATFTKGTSKNDNIVGYAITGTDQKVMFALDAMGDNLTTANVGAFQFAGAVDPNVVFAEEDVTVTTVFTLNTLTADQKTGLYKTLEIGGTAVTTSSAGCTAVMAK